MRRKALGLILLALLVTLVTAGRPRKLTPHVWGPFDVGKCAIDYHTPPVQPQRTLVLACTGRGRKLKDGPANRVAVTVRLALLVTLAVLLVAVLSAASLTAEPTTDTGPFYLPLIIRSVRVVPTATPKPPPTKVRPTLPVDTPIP